MKKYTESFKVTSLDNQIKVLTEELDHVRSVALGLWVRVGTRDEPDDVGGMSHFLEHLLFKGTENRTSREISEAIDALGGEINAFSTKEYTCFYCRLLDEHTSVGIEILADLFQNPLLQKKDIAQEKKVVLEEIRLHQDTPDDEIHDLFASLLFNSHPLGRPILGRTQTVKKFNEKNTLDFFTKFYTPANLVVTAAGSLNHLSVVELIKTYITSPGKKRNIRKEVGHKVSRNAKIYPKKTEQAHLCLGFPGLAAKSPDRFILAVLSNILGGGMSSRLFQEIREKRGLAYSIYSYHSFYTGTGLFATYAGAKPSKIKKVAELVQKEMLKITKKGVTASELHRSKEFLKGQLVLDLESAVRRMTRLGVSEVTHGEILSLDALVNRINKVTIDDVQRLAQRIFDRNKLVIALLGPFKEGSLELNFM